eukprot:Trichotokara_eunicae@DN2931_c0_g1_i1.p1
MTTGSADADKSGEEIALGDDGKSGLGANFGVHENFPIPGVRFIDLMPVLDNKTAFQNLILKLQQASLELGDFDSIAAPEARGFILGSALAALMKKGLVPIRKSTAKIPACKEIHYKTEYGESSLKVSLAAEGRGRKIVIVDDVLATGGTVIATKELLETMGWEVIGMVAAITIKACNGKTVCTKNNLKYRLIY